MKAMSTVRQESVTDGMMQILNPRGTGLALVPLAQAGFIPKVGETVNLDGEGFEVSRVSYLLKSEDPDYFKLASVAVFVKRIERPH